MLHVFSVYLEIIRCLSNLRIALSIIRIAALLNCFKYYGIYINLKRRIWYLDKNKDKSCP